MGERDVSDMEAMQGWMTRLEQYNVFFSSPLDIDFLMLEHFENKYKETLSEKEGPRINVNCEGQTTQMYIRSIGLDGLSYPEYDERVKKDVRLALKECGGDGLTYTQEQQRLMIWYCYFFLSRGKPSTHIAMLSTLDTETLKKSVPPVVQRLIAAAEKALKGNANENNPN